MMAGDVPPPGNPAPDPNRDRDPLHGAPGGIAAVAAATLVLVAAGLAIATLVTLLVG